MPKPVLLTIDDEPTVLRAVERDLRRKYGQEYRVLRADGGQPALDALRQLKQRGEVVALMLSDHRMPNMNGVEFLAEARQLFPDARRVLLTAYADTDAAIRAINEVNIDYYLLKPWDPPEERLYPIIDDLLDDWQAGYKPPYEGVRVIGTRWSPQSHALRDFLGNNQVPYQWLDYETSNDARQLVEASGEGAHVPLVLFADGTRLSEPTNLQVAEKLGLQTRATKPFYDLLIVGGGPAGLAAAVYGASEGLHTALIEREAPGGQAGTSSRIENYLGFPAGLSGADLARRAMAQAQRFGVEIISPQEVTSVRIDGSYRVLRMADGNELSCHALLIASGVAWRRLDLPGVDRLTGAGVYYGAARTEAISCQDEEVFIVGGANSAGQAAMYFARYAAKVSLLVRADSLGKGMSQYLIDQIEQMPNIEVRLTTNVLEVHGDVRLEHITIKNATTGEVETLDSSGLFIMIGAVPQTSWLDGVVERDANGFILSGPDLTRDGLRPKGWKLDRDPFLLETNVPGIFVAGDVRYGSVKRVAAGVGEGGVAVSFVHRYLTQV